MDEIEEMLLKIVYVNPKGYAIMAGENKKTGEITDLRIMKKGEKIKVVNFMEIELNKRKLAYYEKKLKEYKEHVWKLWGDTGVDQLNQMDKELAKGEKNGE